MTTRIATVDWASAFMAGALVAECGADLENGETENPGESGLVTDLEEGPFPRVCFSFHDSHGADALHREDVENHEGEANEGRE